jgi:hypothetical protein
VKTLGNKAKCGSFVVGFTHTIFQEREREREREVLSNNLRKRKNAE